jgi:hypothetical protein
MDLERADFCRAGRKRLIFILMGDFCPQDGHAAAMYFFTCLGGITVIKAPEITSSTAEERREFIKKKYPCIADCDLCGLCKVFRGRNAENAFEDYISGKRSFMDVSADFKRI